MRTLKFFFTTLMAMTVLAGVSAFAQQGARRNNSVTTRQETKAEKKQVQVNEVQKPANVVKVSYCTKSGMYPNSECKEAKTVKSDYFVKGSYLYPKEDKPCKVHATPTPGPVPTKAPEQQPEG